MTSIEWLIDQLEQKGDMRETPSIRNLQLNIDTSDYLELKRQAKEMHKQEIIDAWNGGDYAYFYSKETGRDFADGNDYYQETFVSKGSGDHIVDTNEMVDQVPDVRNMVEDVIDWLINQLENHIVLSAHNKLGTNRTGDYRIGLRKAIDFCHQAKEMEAKETLYTEEEVKLAYIQGYNRGKDGNPNHMEEYITHVKSTKTPDVEISDEEIEKGAKEWYNKEGAYSASAIALKTWVYAIRWYREQLKTK
jgi:hypothetical protein